MPSRGNLLRNLKRGATALCLSGIVVIAGSESALADCHQGVTSGSGSVTVGSACSSSLPSGGTASWNKSGLTISIVATGWCMSSNYCETTWYDWGTSSGHFDARAIRMCYRSASSYSAYNQAESTTGGRTLLGMQKWGTCYGVNNSAGTCVTSSQSISGCTLAAVNHTYPNTSTRMWVRTSTGSYQYYSGGNVSSASA